MRGGEVGGAAQRVTVGGLRLLAASLRRQSHPQVVAGGGEAGVQGQRLAEERLGIGHPFLVHQTDPQAA